MLFLRLSRLNPRWRTEKVQPLSVVAIDRPGALAPFIGVDAQVCGRPVIVPLKGGTPAERPAEYHLASPQEHLPFGVARLMVEGELSDLMKPYVAAAKARGDRVLMLAPDGANHFDIVTPATANGQAVVTFIAANALTPR